MCKQNHSGHVTPEFRPKVLQLSHAISTVVFYLLNEEKRIKPYIIFISKFQIEIHAVKLNTRYILHLQEKKRPMKKFRYNFCQIIS